MKQPCTTCKHEPDIKIEQIGICERVRKFWMCSGEIYKDSSGMLYHENLSGRVLIDSCIPWEAKDAK